MSFALPLLAVLFALGDPPPTSQPTTAPALLTYERRDAPAGADHLYEIWATLNVRLQTILLTRMQLVPPDFLPVANSPLRERLVASCIDHAGRLLIVESWMGVYTLSIYSTTHDSGRRLSWTRLGQVDDLRGVFSAEVHFVVSASQTQIVYDDTREVVVFTLPPGAGEAVETSRTPRPPPAAAER